MATTPPVSFATVLEALAELDLATDAEVTAVQKHIGNLDAEKRQKLLIVQSVVAC